MPLFYFDVETEGQDPQQDRLVTAQYQLLSDDLRPVGDFTVLTEWDWGEKEVVRSVLGKGLFDLTWDFVPVGNRVRFDLTFLMERARHHGIRDWSPAEVRRFWFEKPMLDLSHVLVLMNAGRFEGSSLAAFTDKASGAEVPLLYRRGSHKDILEYVERERAAALELLAELRSMLTAFGNRKRKKA